MLCLLAERVLNAAAILWMVCVRLARDWHTDVAHAGLPGGKSGIAKKEQQKQHIDAEAGARAAVIVAAAVAAALATREAIAPSAGPLIQKANLSAEPAAPAEPAAAAAVAAASSILAALALGSGLRP
jgi:hypothetical protein